MNFFVEHIAIPAADPTALKNWYERVLGAQPLWDDGQQPLLCLIKLPGGLWLEIYAANAPLPERATAITNWPVSGTCPCGWIPSRPPRPNCNPAAWSFPNLPARPWAAARFCFLPIPRGTCCTWLNARRDFLLGKNNPAPDFFMRAIDIQHIGNELAIKWEGGSEDFIPLEQLRRCCPCAGCQGETDIMGNIYKNPAKSLSAAAFRLMRLDYVGGYAIQPVWGDGHATGIFSFDYLKKVAAQT